MIESRNRMRFGDFTFSESGIEIDLLFSEGGPFLPILFDKYAKKLRGNQPEEAFRLKWVVVGMSNGDSSRMVIVDNSISFEEALSVLDYRQRGVPPQAAGYLYMKKLPGETDGPNWEARADGNGEYIRVLRRALPEEHGIPVSRGDYMEKVFPTFFNGDTPHFILAKGEVEY